MPISESQKKFLLDLQAHNGERELREGAENILALRTLANEGYIRFVPAVCGPLRLRTGTFFAQLTDAGRTALGETHAH